MRRLHRKRICAIIKALGRWHMPEIEGFFSRKDIITWADSELKTGISSDIINTEILYVWSIYHAPQPRSVSEFGNYKNRFHARHAMSQDAVAGQA